MNDLTEACADLERWLPALTDALQRDNAPTGRSSSVTAAGVVNPDVLHALITLARQIPATTRTAAELCGENWPPKRPLTTCLRQLPRFAARLENLQLPNAARDIDHHVSHWLSITKYALGLRLPDTPIGYNCPLHDDPSPLVAVGAEGTITTTMNVIWQQGGLITCRSCGAEWPATQWLHLGRILAAS